MFEYFKFDIWMPDIQILWMIICVLVFVQTIALISQLSLVRKNKRFRKQIQEMRKHIQFLSIQSPQNGKTVHK